VQFKQIMKRAMNKFKLLTNGIINENPTFVLVLGMCPTLGTTSSAINGLGMGIATMFVLTLSNISISLVAKQVPDKVRIPVYIVLIAAFVTILQLLMQAYTPGLYATLGIFIPLIVVNCIVLGRAEAYASKNTVFDSTMDGIGIGLGFTLSLMTVGIVRELLGSASFFGMKLMNTDGMLVFVLAPGAFIVLGYIMVLFNKLKSRIS
jgi:Na+-translocating ferredoxin:NAD+ oxidoreductase subunit E